MTSETRQRRYADLRQQLQQHGQSAANLRRLLQRYGWTTTTEMAAHLGTPTVAAAREIMASAEVVGGGVTHTVRTYYDHFLGGPTYD